MSVLNLPRKLTRKCGTIFLDVITFLVFLSLDFLATVLCVIYKLLDELFDGKGSPCYCENKGEKNGECCGEEIKELSETLNGRKNVFREMGFLGFARKCEYEKKNDDDGGRKELVHRWSDCGCESLVSWMKKDDQKLHVFVKELPQGKFQGIIV
ncbi:probable lysophospholipase BODYGUARD 4 [Durio zibethinus]|uniref:Probable lysophospholipase BODYGUARD 4 n=1 Tax=Durio zibethinus TaxID=66656 RepID=A0A6P5WU37_DURZI|nr:probable lysophospholipase BODYGUARD 4 [Durio zibethinus]